ncbi:IS5 family transposase [Paracoccus sp. N5]|uniref:IS5 family transposase n=1 Tax=Paracoccus sp. N5 TaxID=1101189 RepID=UPI001E2D40C7|nr:IS5 family transposase [Paracoccus sp. N5]
MLDALNHAGIAPDKLQMVDSTVYRAHHHAAGAKGGLRKRLLAVREAASRPRSISASTAQALPMRTEITPGQDSDYTGYDMVMADNLPQPAVLVADRGYDSDKIREDIESRNALPMIPMRRNRRVRKAVDMTIYTLRNMVERCFNKLKNSRRLATRYDKTAESFLGFVDVACIRLWLRHLST